MSYYRPQSRRRSNFSGLKLRLIIAAGIMLFAVVSYLGQSDINPVTGEKQRISMTIEEEIQMGLTALPTMIQQHRGYSDDMRATALVKEVGARLLNTLHQRLAASGKQQPYPFDFHLLDDDRNVNAFALPGGQVFITEALLGHMTDNGQLAGVLGHEIGHVLERHSAERVSKSGLITKIASSAGVLGGDMGSMQAAQMVGNLVNMKFGRNDELESDRWGIELMVLAGYHPRHMLSVMDILEKTSGGSGPSFTSTHPAPADRKKHIERIIQEKFGGNLPPGLR